MTLQEIKEQYAKEKGLNDWNHFRKSYGDMHIEGAMNQISIRYAKAKLEEAAEGLNTEKTYDEWSRGWNDAIQKAKQSITKTPLD